MPCTHRHARFFVTPIDFFWDLTGKSRKTSRIRTADLRKKTSLSYRDGCFSGRFFLWLNPAGGRWVPVPPGLGLNLRRLFVCLLWSFDAPRPVVLCRTSRTGGVHFRSVTWPAGWTVHENPSPGADLPLRWILAGGRMADPPGAACGLPRAPGGTHGSACRRAPGPPGRQAPLEARLETGTVLRHLRDPSPPPRGLVKATGNQGSG